MSYKYIPVLLVTFSFCFGETATGPCFDLVCDSINWVIIKKILGSPYSDSGHILKGNRVTEFGENCYLDTFPEEIGNFTELRWLRISAGTMKYLPSSIGNLTKLEYLDLSDNQLVELPPEIGRLVNLKELYLQRNNLTTLPDSIVNITNLDPNDDYDGYKFDVGWNHICSLPPEVRIWVDSMYSGGKIYTGDYVYKGVWEGMQCNDCPNGNRTCESSVRKRINRKSPKFHHLPASGYLFDLRGKRIGTVAGKSEFSRLPRGCYIEWYGGTMLKYRYLAVP